MLFMIRYDSVQYYVEGRNMQDAIDVWREHLKTLPPEDGWSGDEFPDEAAMVHGEPVIRRK